MTPSGVLSRPSPCNVPPVTELSWQLGVGRVKKEYASVAELPAALPGCHFEHPAFGRCSMEVRT